jgi:hypothetical protein
MSYVQLWPPKGADGLSPSEGQDLEADPTPYVFDLPVSGFPFGTYGYSLGSAPAAATAATITVTELVRPSGAQANDWHPVPSEGQLDNPGSTTLNSRRVFTDRIMTSLRFEITVTETLPGFALYADLGKRSDLR